jgi:hypothetical protein
MRLCCAGLLLAFVSAAIGTEPARAQTAAPVHASPSVLIPKCGLSGEQTLPSFAASHATKRGLYNITEAIELPRRLGGLRMHVDAGLVPSPNIAAQAGSIDPNVTAIAMISAPARNRKMQMDELYPGRRLPLWEPCPTTP